MSIDIEHGASSVVLITPAYEALPFEHPISFVRSLAAVQYQCRCSRGAATLGDDSAEAVLQMRTIQRLAVSPCSISYS
jgi:hypothetical protein